jgi:hypothetical protein
MAFSSSTEESERMYSGISSAPKISSGSRSRLKSKEGESRDCYQEQEKGLRRKDYSRMVHFFGGKLFSSTGCFPLSDMALGVFLWRRTRGHEMMEVYANGFAEHRKGYFISSESASGVMTGWRALMGIPNGGGFSPNEKGFSLNSIHGSRMWIFCGFYAKKQEFVRIRLEEKFPNMFETVKIHMHKSKKIIMRQIRKIKFHLYCRNSITPSTN